jgi:hypothetical protein
MSHRNKLYKLNKIFPIDGQIVTADKKSTSM